MDPLTDEQMDRLKEAFEQYMKTSRDLLVAVFENVTDDTPKELLTVGLEHFMADMELSAAGQALAEELEKGGNYDLNLDDIRSETIRRRMDEVRHGPVPNPPSTDRDYGRKE